MNEGAEFKGGTVYYDDINFPYGFKLSGDFTTVQAEILERCGHTLQGLDKGWLEPQNKAQKHFIKVCHEHTEAINVTEKTWLIYKACVARRNSPVNHLMQSTAAKYGGEGAIEM